MKENYSMPIDYNGRVVIPAKLRKRFNLQPEDCVSISADSSGISIVPQEKRCIFCGATTENTILNQRVCEKCVEVIKRR